MQSSQTNETVFRSLPDHECQIKAICNCRKPRTTYVLERSTRRRGIKGHKAGQLGVISSKASDALAGENDRRFKRSV